MSAAVQRVYQLKSSLARVVRPRGAVTHDLVRHDLRAISHASAPATNVAMMMQIQVCFGRPRYSVAGVSAASVRQ